ncbi:MAG: S8 family serine peptidase, partial [Actinomycetes bacterium]
MGSGSFSHRRWRTPTHLLAGASLLFAALFSFLPLTATSAKAADMSCSEMVAADVVTIASMCPNAPTNVSVLASDHGIEVKWDAALVETTEANDAPTSFEVRVTPGDVVVKVTAPVRSASVSGLINGKEYEVSVVARNDFGASEVVGPFLVTPTSGVDGVVGQIIVKYNDGVDATEEEGIATGSDAIEGLELTPLTDLGNGVHTVEISEAVSNEKAAEIIDTLEADPRVAWAEADNIRTTSEAPDPEYAPRQWNLWGDFGVRKLLPATPETTQTGAPSSIAGEGIVVAVIDSGSTPHADMPQPVLEGYDFVSDRPELATPREVNGERVSFDGDYVDSEKYGTPGWDANPADPGDWRDVAPVRTSSWHGTHVAGIIAAQSNNGVGISGVAPGASILPIRALSWNGGLSSDVAAGIIWASGGHVSGVPDNTNVARVINLSISSRSQCSETLQSAIDMATANGSVVVVAAGNANSDVRDYSPANCNNVIAVGATDATGERAVYSNFGEGVDVYAPGGDLNTSGDRGIYSLSNAGVREPAAESYTYRQGTSMAAAHVSGVVARMLSATPTLSVSELRSELQVRSAPRTTPPTACFPDAVNTCTDPVVGLAAAPSSPAGLVVNAGVRSVSMKWTPSADTTVTGVKVQWGTSPTALTNEFTVAGRTTESFVHSGSPVRVLNKSLTSNVATLTTDVAHGLAVGDSVFVSGVDSTLDGTYVVKSKTATTFTYDRVAANVTAIALTTAGSAQKSQSLGIAQTYYYQIAYIYTDNAQSCTTACVSAYSAAVSAQTQFSSSTSFVYTGGVQSYVVPAGIDSLRVEANGGSGGATAGFAAGNGGRVEAVVPV